MSDHKAHQSQIHRHGPGCGHPTVEHKGHQDYLYKGGLDHVHGQKVEPHTLEVNAKNPTNCTPAHSCGAHPADHSHGASCGHETVPHGDHHDYVVSGHLHHPCDGHCDDHGTLTISA